MHMKSAQILRDKLRKIDKKFWSDYRIAQYLDISQSQWKQLLTETKNPSGKTVMALLEVAVDHAKLPFGDIFTSIKSDLSKLPKIERKRRPSGIK